MTSKEFFFDKAIQEIKRDTDGLIRILELGCGTAKYVPTMILKYPDVEYYGIEPIKESYEKALGILKGIPRTKVRFQLGYDRIEELEDHSFDIIISFSVLEHVKQLGRFMDLSARYLKQGGLMIHRYDLGHALYPGSLKEQFQVWLGNTVPSVLPETKFVRYVSIDEVQKHYQRNGIKVTRRTYHQMPNHKRLEKFLDIEDSKIMEEVYKWELENAERFDQIPLRERERLFPAIAIWGENK